MIKELQILKVMKEEYPAIRKIMDILQDKNQ
jgi:hypothetical protein